jgi:hypothetical protein
MSERDTRERREGGACHMTTIGRRFSFEHDA